VVVVEGTLDAMAIAVAAIRCGRLGQFCPVTQSGRELSPLQLEYVLKLHSSDLVLGFDGDTAGRDSTTRVALAAARKGRRVSVASLPEGQDPASWLTEHGDTGLLAFARVKADMTLSQFNTTRWPAASQRLETSGVDPERLIPAI
jgi:DNA primase